MPFPLRVAALLLAAAAACGRLAAEEAPPSPAPPARQEEAAEDALSGMSLEELLEVKVVSASKVPERRADAPATVLLLSREEIRARGYADLSEVLDDLPGMDVVRPYGATYVKSYWRGYRNTIGDPYLLMLDGVVLNHLYFNTADVMAALPLSGIERIEVVYGPASSVYGPNAFMGVVNVITGHDRAEEGVSGSAALSAGTRRRRIADAHVAFRRGELRGFAAVRADDGDLDTRRAGAYEYAKDAYLGDRALWGGFLDNPRLSGTASPHQHRAADLRVLLGDVELGAHTLRIDSGYGFEYAADRAQRQATWARPERSVHLRLARRLSDRLSSATLLRYRESGVSSDSFFLEAPLLSAPGHPVRLSYWQSLNSSWSAFQDVDLRVSDSLSLGAGLKYERKDLQKAYDTSYGPELPASAVDASLYPYPPPPPDTPQAQNRTITTDEGAYVQGRLAAARGHRLHLGLRTDRNSQYGRATTVRGGHVGTWGRWGTKALYGEAFQEPVPRLLYGGWTGSGSDPDLRPERSRTFEASVSHARRRTSYRLGGFLARNRDTIINTAQGAMNVGDRRVAGLEAEVQVRLAPPRLRRLELWAHLQRLLQAREREGEGAPERRIGDLADLKLHLGARAVFAHGLAASLRARVVGARPTVASNPAGEVDGFLTADAHVSWQGLRDRLGLSARVTNLFDADYAHPGVRDASAGFAPGGFDANGVWRGSAGFYSSLLPQPGRAALLTVRVEF